MKSFVNDLLFPEQLCLLCEKPTSNRGDDQIIISKKTQLRMKNICISCQDQLELPTSPHCFHCHKPIRINTSQSKVDDSQSHSIDFLCSDCKQNSHQTIEQNRSATIYNERMKEYLALYKYRGKESLAIPFSRLLKVTYDHHYQNIPIDLITYVPLHSSRLQERSFNQAEQLATRVSSLVGKPVIDTLERTKETHKQSKSGKWERLEEMQGAFQVKTEAIQQINGKTILIIDDIYTTGATLNECAKELVRHGTKQVYSLTLARA